MIRRRLGHIAFCTRFVDVVHGNWGRGVAWIWTPDQKMKMIYMNKKKGNLEIDVDIAKLSDAKSLARRESCM
jgi:hypothetical protein